MPNHVARPASEERRYARSEAGGRSVRRPWHGTAGRMFPTHPRVRPGSYGTNLPFSYYGLRYDVAVPVAGWRQEYEEPGYGAVGTYWQLYDYEPFGPSYGPGCWFDPT